MSSRNSIRQFYVSSPKKVCIGNLSSELHCSPASVTSAWTRAAPMLPGHGAAPMSAWTRGGSDVVGGNGVWGGETTVKSSYHTIKVLPVY